MFSVPDWATARRGTEGSGRAAFACSRRPTEARVRGAGPKRTTRSARRKRTGWQPKRAGWQDERSRTEGV